MRYRQRYGDDILVVRRSLFERSSEAERRVRRLFWALISDLIAERYFGQIQKWARAHRVASSGHTLREETPLHHIPLEGNALKVLRRMDIPGLDMLTSDPEAVIYSGWLTASLPATMTLLLALMLYRNTNLPKVYCPFPLQKVNMRHYLLDRHCGFC